MDGLSMNIATLSTDITTSRTMAAVSTAIMKKNMEIGKDMGNEMTKMMETPITPHLGKIVDVRL